MMMLFGNTFQTHANQQILPQGWARADSPLSTHQGIETTWKKRTEWASHVQGWVSDCGHLPWELHDGGGQARRQGRKTAGCLGGDVKLSALWKEGHALWKGTARETGERTLLARHVKCLRATPLWPTLGTRIYGSESGFFGFFQGAGGWWSPSDLETWRRVKLLWRKLRVQVDYKPAWGAGGGCHPLKGSNRLLRPGILSE